MGNFSLELCDDVMGMMMMMMMMMMTMMTMTIVSVEQRPGWCKHRLFQPGFGYQYI